LRRQFLLPEADREHLEAWGLEWETIIESGVRWLLLHAFPVPEGYNHRTVTVAVMISAGYPAHPWTWFISTRTSPEPTAAL
jgi:hypothetical protein